MNETQAPPIAIRAAIPADVPALVAMVNAAYRVSEGHVFPGTERVQRTDAMAKLDGTLVAIIDDAVVGCVRYETEGGIAHFGLLSTDVTRQRGGIASSLIAHVEALARDAGCATMRIEVVKQGGAIPFYERRGYRGTRETDGQQWNKGADWGAVIPWQMVDMEKPL